jgi:hypothetical protein
LICIVQGWLLLFLPYLLAEGISEETFRAVLLGAAGVTVAALLFYWIQPGIDDCPTDTPRWLRQAGCAGLASLLGLVPLPMG